MEVVLSFLNNDDPNIRYFSAWVIASLIQNNEKTKLHAQINLLSLLIETLSKENNYETKGKQMFALTALLSENLINVLSEIISKLNLIPLLIKIVSDPETALQTKSIWILIKLTSFPNFNTIVIQSNFLEKIVNLLKNENTPQDLKLKCLLFIHKFLNSDQSNVKFCLEYKGFTDLISVLEKSQQDEEICSQIKLIISLLK